MDFVPNELISTLKYFAFEHPYCLFQRASVHLTLSTLWVQREWAKQFKDDDKVVGWPNQAFESFIIVVSPLGVQPESVDSSCHSLVLCK